MTSRPAPPVVLPIEHQGVLYVQDPASRFGGSLIARHPATGEQLWQLQVYDVQRDPAAPFPHPGRFFRSMRLVPGCDELEIEDEIGQVFRVDLAARTPRGVRLFPVTNQPAVSPPSKPLPQ